MLAGILLALVGAAPDEGQIREYTQQLTQQIMNHTEMPEELSRFFAERIVDRTLDYHERRVASHRDQMGELREKLSQTRDREARRRFGQQLRAMRKEHKDLEELDLEDMQPPYLVNQVVGNAGVRPEPVEVLQVISETQVVVRMREGPTFIDGVPTANLEVGTRTRIRPMLGVVDSRRYTTIFGGTKQAMVLQPLLPIALAP